VRVVDASADGELVRERLEVMGLGFDASRAGSAVHATCDRVTVVCLSKEMSDRACEIAQYVACICRLWRYTKPVKIIVAARRASKVVSFRRPLVMDDINSGVTYHKDGTIIMFRSDPDFWKVLCHECIHLCRGEDDEAKTEFEALLVHTMVVSSDWGDFTRRFDEQKRRSRANSDVLRHVHPGDTNAARYWQVGCEMLHNAEDVLGGRWRKVALRPGDFVLYVLDSDGS